MKEATKNEIQVRSLSISDSNSFDSVEKCFYSAKQLKRLNFMNCDMSQCRNVFNAWEKNAMNPTERYVNTNANGESNECNDNAHDA